MKLGGLRCALLATASAAALLIGTMPSSLAAPCTIANTAPVDNTTPTNCITFNNGAAFTGAVTNSSTLTPNGSTATGSGTGISVVAASSLNGTITNNGTILVNVSPALYGIRVFGATVEGSLINNNTINVVNANGGGLVVNSASLISNGSAGSGSVINNGTITTVGTISNALDVEHSTVGGSVSNGGTIDSGGRGIFVFSSTVLGSISNSGALTYGGFSGIALTGPGVQVAGNIVNTGTITHPGAGSNVGIIVSAGVSVGGSVINNGTISGGGGILAFNGWTIAGNISNGGTITVSPGTTNPRPGIYLLTGTLEGAVINSGSITAPTYGIRLTSAASVVGGITNSGSIAAATCILVQGGAVAGTITNSGTMTCGTTAINLTGEGAPTTVDQTAGTITGPILLSSLGDIVNISGGTVNGDIVGTGTSGTVNFNIGAGNTFTYAAPFGFSGIAQANINSGTVVLNGVNSATAVDVNSGGTLAGTGTVGSLLNVNSGGTFAPGTPGVPGTSMTVAGNLAFESGALYMVTLNPSTSSFADVTGTASLAGTVDANFLPGDYSLRMTYDILHSAGLNGTTFSGLMTNMPNFSYMLTYSGTDVFLTITDAQLGHGLLLNQSQQGVANVINNAFNSTGSVPPQFANLFNLTGTNLTGALTQLEAENGTGAERASFDLMNEFLGLMLDPYVPCEGQGQFDEYGANALYCRGAQPLGFASEQQAEFPPDVALAYDSVFKAPLKAPAPVFEQRWTAWAAGFGGSATATGDPTVGSNNVTTSTYGYAAGMDYHYSPDTVLGFALAGGGTNWNLANALGSGRSDALLAGVYGVTHQGPWYLAGALAFANNWFTTDRTALGDQLTASFQGQSYAARLEGGYRFVVPVYQYAVGVTPYAAIQAQDFQTPAYSETDLTGGGFGLSYAAMNGTDTRSELGGRFDAQTIVDAMPLILRAKLAWAHDWVSDPALNATFESLPGASFTVFGAPIPHDSALTSVAAQVFFTPNWSFVAKFDGEFASASQTYAGSGTLRYTW